MGLGGLIFGTPSVSKNISILYSATVSAGRAATISNAERKPSQIFVEYSGAKSPIIVFKTALLSGERFMGRASTSAEELNLINPILSQGVRAVMIVFMVCFTRSNLVNPSSSPMAFPPHPSPMEPELSITASSIIGLRFKRAATDSVSGIMVTCGTEIPRNSSIRFFRTRFGTNSLGCRGRRVIGEICLLDSHSIIAVFSYEFPSVSMYGSSII
mmetsp:Transcript_71318/g.140041  ORF Transcript_71318/g.140041 Transcript_71318/m.140041 type:complete len:214 (-) Transcript_71318:67-708(-)